ncbi:hypothetical protein B0H14DRAFT_3514513 [Mycena olivaceomarginata]|nr:hypothetical protein B0H14DRAFT_3514513 [Mycena olivaceomarginata]
MHEYKHKYYVYEFAAPFCYAPPPPLVAGLVEVTEETVPTKREEEGGHPHQLPSPLLSPTPAHRVPARQMQPTPGEWTRKFEARLGEADLAAMTFFIIKYYVVQHPQLRQGVEVVLVDVGAGDEDAAEARAREAPLWVEEASLLLDLDTSLLPAVEQEPAPVLIPMDVDDRPADEDAHTLARPSTHAIDAVVCGMHELERAAPPLEPPPPAVVSLMDRPAGADADREADGEADDRGRGMHMFPFLVPAPPPLPLSTSTTEGEGEAAPAYVNEPSPSPSTPTPAYTADPAGLALPVPSDEGEDEEDSRHWEGEINGEGSKHGWDGPVCEVVFPETPTYAREESPCLVGSREEQEEEEENPEELVMPFIPLPSPSPSPSLPVVVEEEDKDPEELPLPVMPLPPIPHKDEEEDDTWDTPPPPVLRVSSPPHLHVNTAPATDGRH